MLLDIEHGSFGNADAREEAVIVLDEQSTSNSGEAVGLWKTLLSEVVNEVPFYLQGASQRESHGQMTREKR